MVYFNAGCKFAVLGEHAAPWNCSSAPSTTAEAVADGWKNDSDLASLRGQFRFQTLLGRLH